MAKYFKPEETTCKCGCGMQVKEELLDKLDEAREIAGIPFKITSGARCENHNAKIGASATSSHTRGLAVDIACVDRMGLARIVYGLTKAGFTRFGIHDKFVHADIDSNKPDAFWKY